MTVQKPETSGKELEKETNKREAEYLQKDSEGRRDRRERQ